MVEISQAELTCAAAFASFFCLFIVLSLVTWKWGRYNLRAAAFLMSISRLWVRDYFFFTVFILLI